MLSKSKDHNPNYLCSVLRVENIRPHSNADRLQIVNCYANNVITGISTKVGDLVVYFPLESQISLEFLAYTNSLDDATLNKDTTVRGFFSAKQRRVKALRLRGEKSEGYLVPIAQLQAFCKDVLGKKVVFNDSHIGQDFDEIEGHLLCKKYVVPTKQVQGISKKTKGNIKRYVSKLVENQFHFHPDTLHLKREVRKLNPDDYIALTNKLHGCNFIVSNVRVKRKLTWKDKIAKFIGAKVEETEYGMLYSSRAVLKNSTLNEDKDHKHFYVSDIWKIVADRIYPFLKAGISVTGEIVGYTPTGKAIQPKYDYGCKPNELDFYVFNVTHTSYDGVVYTFSHQEKEDFCVKHGFKTPKTFYYGKAKDLFSDIKWLADDDAVKYDSEKYLWHDKFLQLLIDTYLEKKCDLCKNDVWAEGVILNIQTPFEWIALKLKSFNFLGYETELLDKGEVDIDAEAAIVDDDENTI